MFWLVKEKRWRSLKKDSSLWTKNWADGAIVVRIQRMREFFQEYVWEDIEHY